MKIVHIILISFVSILLLFTFTTYINYRQSGELDKNSEKLAQSTLVISHSNRFQRNFLNMVSGLRGYLLTHEQFFIQTYDSAVVENEQILTDLTSLITDRPEQKQLLADIHTLNEYWKSEFATPLLQAKQLTIESDSGKAAFKKLYQSKLTDGMEKKVQISIQKKFSAFTNYEYDFRTNQRIFLDDYVQKTKEISIYLTIISVVAGICIAFFMAYYISSRIVKMVKMANAIAEGDYQVNMRDDGQSELSQLAKALNNMARILNTNISLLQRQKEDLNQFAHIVSHDLRAPLRGIDNVVTWIEEDHSFDLPDKVNEYLELIKGRIIRAENLLKGILVYARLGKETRNKEEVDISLLIQEIQEDIILKPGLKIVIQPNLPVLITERVPILQVFTNLITNAIKYNDKQNGMVKISYQTMPDHYEFFIEDNGIGIDEKYHQKIFLIFQTLQEKDAVESTGVGLAIVKKILEDRDLKINIQSVPGEGSVFSFTWPKK